MSRPPSRADNSRLDLSAEHVAASSSNVMTLKEQEEMNDRELQRAMAESLKQNVPAQENGVTQAGGQFGPARQGYDYEPNTWALTTYSTSREIIEHPPPAKRRKTRGTPAFLRGSKETGHLSSLLTIYHNIPLARSALLMPSLKVHGYAHDSSWWSGSTDENTKSLSTDHTLHIDQNERNLLTEVQCLMAFLDRTTRAYGSVDALADLQAVRNRSGDALFQKFLEGWSAAALKQSPGEQLTLAFSSTAMKADEPGQDTAVEKTLHFVDPYINHVPDETLTNLLDTTIWNDETGRGIDDVWISHCAEIFTIRLKEPKTPTSRAVDISLDPVWYADRYMHDCREEMLQIRGQVQTIRRQIETLTHMQRRCQIFHSDNKPLDIGEVLNAAVKASIVAAGQHSVINSSHDNRELTPEARATQEDVDELGTELQNVLQKIRQRLAQLEQRKEDLRARSRQITMQLTRPTPERPNFPHRKYILHGVATKPGVTYFRRQNPDPDLLEDDDEMDGGDIQWEWWRSSWHPEEARQAPHPPMVGPLSQAEAERLGKSDVEEKPPWSIERVLETDVLEAAKKEYNSVLLVYANERAVEFPPGELSPSLRHFVDRDNHAFAEDLLEDDGPLTDSFVDRDADTEFEDVPLIDPTRSSSSARELTPMSTSSPDHDDDPPALKRAGDGSHENVLTRLPTYEESISKQEMQEKNQNKIGLYAEKLLQRYGSDGGRDMGDKDQGDDLLHLEDER